MSKFLRYLGFLSVVLILDQCATIRQTVPFMGNDSVLTQRQFWKQYAEFNAGSHNVAGKGFVQVDVPNLAAKVRAQYGYSSRGLMKLELSTIIIGKLADIYLVGDTAIVNDYVNRQSFVDATENLELPGIGGLTLGDWDLNTLFLGLAKLNKNEWRYNAEPEPILIRPNEVIKLDARGRILAWLVHPENSENLTRQLDLEYETEEDAFPVAITMTDYVLKRKIKLTHQRVVWDDPDFQVKAIAPVFSPKFQFSILRDN